MTNYKGENLKKEIGNTNWFRCVRLLSLRPLREKTCVSKNQNANIKFQVREI
jgi:hypothetical protein